MIAIDLSKQKPLAADPKVIQETIFIGNLSEEATMFFITEEVKETIFNFSQEIVSVL